MTAQGGRLFLQFSLAFQIFREYLPLCCSFCTIGFHQLVVEKLRRVGIAVVKVVVAVINNLAIHLSTAKNKVVKHLATDETDMGDPT